MQDVKKCCFNKHFNEFMYVKKNRPLSHLLSPLLLLHIQTALMWEKGQQGNVVCSPALSCHRGKIDDECRLQCGGPELVPTHFQEEIDNGG
jgi:hypothetical protein